MAVTSPSEPLRLRVRTTAPPEAVYRALTDPDLLIEWLTDEAQVALDQGQYQFWGRYVPLGDRARQHLTEATQNSLLRFTWDLDGPEQSTVELGIVAHDEGGSEVRVEHSGIPATVRTALDCFWHVSLANLVAQVEDRPTMPPFDFRVPAQTDVLVRTVIDRPAEDVYAALLNQELVGRWVGSTAVIEPRVGGRYEFGWGHGPTKIVDLEPDRTIAYIWRYPQGTETTVRWNLRQTRGSTYLTLVHSGFDDDALAEQVRQGWPGQLVELKRLLEIGDGWEPMRA